jgi:hypothetical protein
MRFFDRLKALFDNERGNVLIIGAATLPLLMGAAAFAIDTTQMALWKRQLQRAADSASIAGARALSQQATIGTAVANDLDEHVDYDLEDNETPTITDKEVLSGSFAAGTLNSQTCAVRAVSPCYGKAVQVTIAAERHMPFLGLFTSKPTIIRATGTAAVVANGEFCLVSLYEGNDPGIIAGGNPNLDLSCGIVTNSGASNAVNVYGSATIKASPVAAVGGITGGTHYVGTTTLQPYSEPVRDPFESVPDPVLPAGCATDTTLHITGGTALNPIVIPDGACYGNYDIDGYAKIADGGRIYVNNGKLDLKGSLSGTHVTLIMMGTDSTWVQNGGGKLSLTGPLDGDYKGIVVFRDRNAGNVKNKEIKINGGADMTLVGAIYGRSTDFWVGGNAEIDSQCIQVVGRKIEFKGGGTIHNKCDDTGAQAFEITTVRLVK